VTTILIWSGLLFGLAAASIALYGRYRTLPAFLTGPAICRLEDNGCALLFRTRLAAILGVPNSLLGIFLYLSVASVVLMGWPTEVALVGTSAGLAMSGYLAFRLIRDRLECRVCWIGHLANSLLWLGLLLRVIGRQR
jgi:uncharacterized membrane protein